MGESDDVILRLLSDNTGLVVAGILGAAIIACVMASDSQILALCSMFTEDVFAYYGGKEKLWNSAVDWLFEESIRAVDLGAVDRAANDVERFELLVRHYVRYSARHPEHARLVIQESLRPGKRLRRIVALARRHHDAVAPLIGRLMDQGHIVRMDPVSIAYIFSSACQSVFVLAREASGIYGKRVLSEAFIESHVAAVISLFLRR